MPTSLIEASDLNKLNHNTVFLDASFILPNSSTKPSPSADQAHANCHIPNAQRFDVNTIADIDSDLPHMLPSAEKFSHLIGKMGIDNNTTVVCYEQNTLMGAARAWWMFRVFGHENVFVLNGGLAAYQAAGLPTADTVTTMLPRTFDAYYQDHLVADMDMMVSAIEANQLGFDHGRQIIDARSQERFAGTAPEPRENLRAGHMLTAVNLPFNNLFDENNLLLPKTALINAFEAHGVDTHTATITTCGSGVTACTLALALYELGNTDVAVYDGSWAEWGNDETLPITLL